MTETRDHGGGLDAAVAQYGGVRSDWLDLSTGINPVPYPIGEISEDAWTALPDRAAQDRLITAARAFWNVPAATDVIAAPGASALIARLPALIDYAEVHIPSPTYNEHAAAFEAQNRSVAGLSEAAVHVYVHPNNPDGKLWPDGVFSDRPFTIIDESFCDVVPQASHIDQVENSGTIILKSFGKFWGLAGLRLGFAIATPQTFTPVSSPTQASFTDLLGPWPVAGPALDIGARALEDVAWADATRARLTKDADRLDALMTEAGAKTVGGTTLFRLYDVGDAAAWQDRLAQNHIWSRIFPYSDSWLRLGLPHPDRWGQLEAALA